MKKVIIGGKEYDEIVKNKVYSFKLTYCKCCYFLGPDLKKFSELIDKDGEKAIGDIIKSKKYGYGSLKQFGMFVQGHYPQYKEIVAKYAMLM